MSQTMSVKDLQEMLVPYLNEQFSVAQKNKVIADYFKDKTNRPTRAFEIYPANRRPMYINILNNKLDSLLYEGDFGPGPQRGGAKAKKSKKSTSATAKKKSTRKPVAAGKVRTGPRGGKFVVRGGNKVYV